MLVDDDFTLRASLAELLTLEGYRVVCAADGIEGISCLEREPDISAILLDIVMPTLDGVELRQRQMRASGLRGVPTIALTSLRNLEFLDPFAFDAVFRKPLDTDRLLRTLSGLCSKRS